MLFCSYEFILVFLPLVLTVVLGASALGRRDLAKVFLFVASLVYYAWWNPKYVTLLLVLLAFNFAIGRSLVDSVGAAGADRRRKTLLWTGILANVGALFYYKYANFFVEVIGSVSGSQFTLEQIVLPLGISFIVFQKIAFLVDAYGGQIKTLNALDYGLFVSFFPQLIAGPIVHHREVMPQFESPNSLRFSFRLLALALSFFVLGLAKKILLADSLSEFASSGFRQNTTSGLDAVTAWLSALAYTLQVYFDFSGYSDMAIGLGLMFGVRLPFNFNSPLKARSMIEFWSRWHMTLTRFLTAYVYNPLVLRATRRRLAARKKTSLRGPNASAAFVWLLAIPTMITMFIAGAWHGAGFQFIIFGLVHGAYLVINHACRTFRKHGPPTTRGTSARWYQTLGARSLTLFALLISMPFFRAPSATSALQFVRAMFGSNGFFHPAASSLRALAQIVHLSPRAVLSLLDDNQVAYALPLLFLASQLLPNTQQILREPLEAATGPLAKHAGEGSTMDLAKASSWSWPTITWNPSLRWALGLALVGWYTVTHLVAPTEFLYFQF